MNPLSLHPLPAHRSEDESLNRQMEREGFVDEAVVTAMLARPYAKRSVAYPEDLALAADDQDFAGWSLAPSSPLRVAGSEPAPVKISPLVFRTTAPATAEAQQDQPQAGNRLLWLAGLACVLSGIFFAAVMISGVPSTEAPSFKKGTPPTPAPQAETTPLPAFSGQARP